MIPCDTSNTATVRMEPEPVLRPSSPFKCTHVSCSLEMAACQKSRTTGKHYDTNDSAECEHHRDCPAMTAEYPQNNTHTLSLSLVHNSKVMMSFQRRYARCAKANQYRKLRATLPSRTFCTALSLFQNQPTAHWFTPRLISKFVNR
jgi:hypothetical protein